MKIELGLFATTAAAVATAGSLRHTDEALADQINDGDLPGLEAGAISFNQFSGYLTVNEETGKNLHYWFVESENDPANDPVALWSNGGPGCSGLIGFMTEQGPFRPEEDLSLSLNPNAWNKVANMMFIEAPAGVGFSYSDTKSDYTTGDYTTAQDNYKAVLEFLERFPDLADNEFFTTSESYGGHYMPTLAKAIVDGNAAGDNPQINYKGFAVGNPYTDPTENKIGEFGTLFGHQVVSKPTYDTWAQECSYASGGSDDDGSNGDEGSRLKCGKAERAMDQEAGNLNPYALDWPVCDESGGASRLAQRLRLKDFITPDDHPSREAGGPLEHLSAAAQDPTYQPCTDNWASDYLNQASVQAALHVNSTKWSECSYSVNYNMSDSNTPMEPVYQELIDGDADLRIMVFSGDDDTVCGTMGTQSWIYDLGYTQTDAWTPWTYTDSFYGEQTGGFMTKWGDNGLTFATVHGAGHEVPTYKGEAALDLISKYFADEL